jgi:hypothetical protein
MTTPDGTNTFLRSGRRRRMPPPSSSAAINRICAKVIPPRFARTLAESMLG